MVVVDVFQSEALRRGGHCDVIVSGRRCQQESLQCIYGHVACGNMQAGAHDVANHLVDGGLDVELDAVVAATFVYEMDGVDGAYGVVIHIQLVFEVLLGLLYSVSKGAEVVCSLEYRQAFAE